MVMQNHTKFSHNKEIRGSIADILMNSSFTCNAFDVFSVCGPICRLDRKFRKRAWPLRANWSCGVGACGEHVATVGLGSASRDLGP